MAGTVEVPLIEAFPRISSFQIPGYAKFGSDLATTKSLTFASVMVSASKTGSFGLASKEPVEGGFSPLVTSFLYGRKRDESHRMGETPVEVLSASEL